MGYQTTGMKYSYLTNLNNRANIGRRTQNTNLDEHPNHQMYRAVVPDFTILFSPKRTRAATIAKLSRIIHKPIPCLQSNFKLVKVYRDTPLKYRTGYSYRCNRYYESQYHIIKDKIRHPKMVL